MENECKKKFYNSQNQNNNLSYNKSIIPLNKFRNPRNLLDTSTDIIKANALDRGTLIHIDEKVEIQDITNEK